MFTYNNINNNFNNLILLLKINKLTYTGEDLKHLSSDDIEILYINPHFLKIKNDVLISEKNFICNYNLKIFNPRQEYIPYASFYIITDNIILHKFDIFGNHERNYYLSDKIYLLKNSSFYYKTLDDFTPPKLYEDYGTIYQIPSFIFYLTL